MPTISAKVIIPRKNRFCGSFAHSGDDLMPKGQPQMRLYGNGCEEDPKYTMYICLECASKSTDQKIVEVLSAYNKQIKQGGLISGRDGAKASLLQGRQP